MANTDSLSVLPVVLVAGDKQSSLISFVDGIVGKDQDKETNGTCDVNALWTVDTKYYTAEVAVHAVSGQQQVDDKLWSRVEAFVYVCDPAKTGHLRDLSAWDEQVQQQQPETLLCVVDRVDGQPTSEPSLELHDWCQEHGYELLEVDSWSSNNAFSTIHNEATGMARAIEAMQVTMWSNMVRKTKQESSKHSTTSLSDVKSDTSQAKVASNSENSEFLGRTLDNGANHATNLDKASDTAMVDGLMTDEDMESLETLMADLSMMRERAADLPTEQRHELAERISLGFYRAMGGIDDFEDSSDYDSE